MAHPVHTTKSKKMVKAFTKRKYGLAVDNAEQRIKNINREINNLAIVGERFKWDMRNKDVKMRLNLFLQSL